MSITSSCFIGQSVGRMLPHIMLVHTPGQFSPDGFVLRFDLRSPRLLAIHCDHVSIIYGPGGLLRSYKAASRKKLQKSLDSQLPVGQIWGPQDPGT